MFLNAHDGMLVVDGDTECADACRRNIGDIEKTAAYCSQRRVCVQAGGNLGYWPLKLASMFNMVYSFEPDPYNFACLVYNTRNCKNVVRVEGALSNVSGQFVGLKRYPENVGAHQVSGRGVVPCFTVDSFDFPFCDLLYLDIEGYEPQALLGALRTIARHKPVICIEDKGLCDARLRAEVLGVLEQAHGYRHIASINRDKIFTCETKS